jgi:hypothetical protein
MWDLDIEVQKQIVKERIIKLSQDGYQLELNYKFALTQENEEATEQYKTSVSSVAASLAFHKEELAKLEA